MTISQYLRTFAVGLLVLLAVTESNAFHIIGGEITYQCLGPGATTGTNRYQFEMFVYRDCRMSDQPAADFDGTGTIPPAQIAIWAFQDGAYRRLDQFELLPENIQDIDPPEIECLIPPENICAERGFYTWTVDLPTIDESYHVTYQRCCRNSTISNIIDPADSGATFTMELLPNAQSECNNSPTYDQFPPTIVCVNEEVSFNHSASDVDGDSLVYSFVNPLLGGSLAEAQPIGDPPPYARILFRTPIYTALEPMGGDDGGDPGVSIDPITGLISGIPKTIGQFVVGVRVTEFRDGVKIGELNRDFQFNVASCESTVVASLVGDETIGDQSYTLTSCGEQTITFQNTSIDESEIFSYQWEFPTVEGDTLRSSIRNATIAFPDTGTYFGIMYLNRNSICEDSASIAVRIFPETTADYSFQYDTCVVGPVIFNNLSMTGSEGIVSYEWDFGGTGSSTSESPIYNFPTPSTQPVALTVEDVNGCRSTSLKDVIWQPAPQTVIVQPNAFLGCAPATMSFLNLSNPIDDTYTFNWDFGDGNTSNDLSPDHTYETSGIYDVSLEIISPIGCQVQGSFNSLIRIEEGPTAEFSFSPTELSSIDRRVEFVDQSTDASAWFWNFGDESFSILEDPIYTFQDTGLQEVRLIITKANGCQDTVFKQLDIVPKVRFHMPNAFTPNNDGVNESFLGRGVLTGMREFQFTIWNRWGEQIFTTTNPDEGWNGRKNNVGEISPIGSYPYLVSFREPRGEVVRMKGHANLVR